MNIFPGHSCLTIEGTGDMLQYVGAVLEMAGQIGLQCKFPFSIKYSFFSFGPFDACADPADLGIDLAGQLVCATSVDDSGNGISYGVCDPNCPSGK